MDTSHRHGRFGMGFSINSHDTAYDISADGGSVIVVLPGTTWSSRRTDGLWRPGCGAGRLARRRLQVQQLGDGLADGSVVAGTATSAAGTEAFRWTQATEWSLAYPDPNPLHPRPPRFLPTAVPSTARVNAGDQRRRHGFGPEPRECGSFRMCSVSEHGLGRNGGWPLVVRH